MIWIGDNDTQIPMNPEMLRFVRGLKNASVWTDLNITDDTITPLVPSHRHVRI